MVARIKFLRLTRHFSNACVYVPLYGLSMCVSLVYHIGYKYRVRFACWLVVRQELEAILSISLNPDMTRAELDMMVIVYLSTNTGTDNSCVSTSVRSDMLKLAQYLIGVNVVHHGVTVLQASKCYFHVFHGERSCACCCCCSWHR
jgi:hypothetical protein